MGEGQAVAGYLVTDFVMPYQCHFLEPKYKNIFYRKIDCDIQTNLKNKSLALDLAGLSYGGNNPC